MTDRRHPRYGHGDEYLAVVPHKEAFPVSQSSLAIASNQVRFQEIHNGPSKADSGQMTSNPEVILKFW
jgi:hypothetical protein